MSRFRLALIPLSLALLGIGGPSVPDFASGGGAAVREAVAAPMEGLALAALDGTPRPQTAKTGAADQSPPQGAKASERYLPTARTVWLWYMLLAAGLLIVMASFLMLALWLGRRFRDDLISTRPRQFLRPLAYLDALDGSSQRHPVTGTDYRIGRHSDNDLSIRDASVSRQHAEISLKSSGNFIVTDLDSMNGVFVNQRKVDSVVLADGDVVEIGDKSFRFRTTQHPSPTGDDT